MGAAAPVVRPHPGQHRHAVGYLRRRVSYEIVRTAAEAFGPPGGQADARTAAQRRMDGLVAACKAALDGGQAPERHGAAPHITILVKDETLAQAATQDAARAVLPPRTRPGRRPPPGRTCRAGHPASRTRTRRRRPAGWLRRPGPRQRQARHRPGRGRGTRPGGRRETWPAAGREPSPAGGTAPGQAAGTLAGQTAGAPPGQTSHGTALTARQVLALCCGAQVGAIRWRDGLPLGVGRTMRTEPTRAAPRAGSPRPRLPLARLRCPGRLGHRPPHPPLESGRRHQPRRPGVVLPRPPPPLHPPPRLDHHRGPQRHPVLHPPRRLAHPRQPPPRHRPARRLTNSHPDAGGAASGDAQFGNGPSRRARTSRWLSRRFFELLRDQDYPALLSDQVARGPARPGRLTRAVKLARCGSSVFAAGEGEAGPDADHGQAARPADHLEPPGGAGQPAPGPCRRPGPRCCRRPPRWRGRPTRAAASAPGHARPMGSRTAAARRRRTRSPSGCSPRPRSRPGGSGRSSWAGPRHRAPSRSEPRCRMACTPR